MAKEAADIVLLDDDLQSVYGYLAIEYRRERNLGKSVHQEYRDLSRQLGVQSHHVEKLEIEDIEACGLELGNLDLFQ